MTSARPGSILITGGARSGKSRFAEQLACSIGLRRCYLATAQPLDDEMAERITRHQVRRGADWETIEEPLLISQCLARVDGVYDVILLDCVTLWLSNLLCSYTEDHPDAESEILARVHRLADTLQHLDTPVVLVTNEVGQGIVPDNPLARQFRDLAGQANQLLAAACDSVYVVISGIPLQLK